MPESDPLKLPNFIVAGVAKSGTTSLHHYLRQHPQVYMNPVKEPTYFGVADLRLREDLRATIERERVAMRAYLDGPQLEPAQYLVTEWDDYVRLFRNVRDETAVDEASVSYFWMPSAAGAIRSKLPDVRLIFVLRDPADRLFSWYLITHRRHPGMTFRAWLLKQMNGGRDYGPAVHAGRFATHLQRFFDLFPRDQVRVYLYESFHTDTGGVLRDIFAFLGLDPDQPIDVSHRQNETLVPRFPVLDRLRRRFLGNGSLTGWLPGPVRGALGGLYHRRRGSFAMAPADRRMVIEYYRGEILRAAHLIGRDLSAWLR